MKSFSQIRLRKFVASIALIVAAISLPLAATAADMVKFEAATSIANMTAGDTSYSSSVNAKYNDVMKVQVIYNDTEDAGSTKTANNVHVKFSVPNAVGTNQVINTTTSADNVTTVKGSATAVLSRNDAELQYIPGTAVWKHANTANGPLTVEQKISDDVVTAANGVNLGNENPCQAGSVTIQVGVVVPTVSVTKSVRALGTSTWKNTIDAKAGEVVQFMIAYKNTGTTEEDNVVVRDNLPPDTSLVPGTTYLKNSTYPTGLGKLSTSDALATNGINITNYAPGGAAYVTFNVQLPGDDKLQCGDNTFTNVGVVKPQGLSEFYNTAYVHITKTCAATPTYSCNAFEITADNASHKVTVGKFDQSATNGATFKNVVISWGDNSDALTTNNVVGQTHSYSADGTYSVTATAHFTVNNADVTATDANCAKTVTFSSTKPPVVTTVSTPVQPTTLVNTGPGQLAGLFVAITIAGMVAYRSLLKRNLSQN